MPGERAVFRLEPGDSRSVHHTPGRSTQGQLSRLAGLKPSGGHFNASREDLRSNDYVGESNGLVTATPEGLQTTGAVSRHLRRRLSSWRCDATGGRLRHRRRCAHVCPGRELYQADELAALLDQKPTAGHWGFGVATLRNNGLIEAGGRRYGIPELFRPLNKEDR